MMNRASRLFNVRPGEGRLVLLLVALHFCIASSVVFVNTAAYALFFESFDIQRLPWLYIAIALVVSSLTTFYLRVTARVPLARLVLINLTVLLVGCIVFRVGIAVLQAAWLVFVLPIWYQTVNNLGSLTLWSTAGTLFDMRQGKRVFGLVNSGAWVASAAAGFLVSPLVRVIGTPNLFLLASVTLGMGILCLTVIVREHGGRLRASAQGSTRQPRTPLRDLLRVRYIALLFSMLILWYIGYFFIDNIFYDRVTQQFPDTDAMAAFLGSFFGFIGILGLVVDLFVTSRVIGRFGLRGAYMIMPITVSLCAAGIALTGTIAGEVAALFWLATAAKLMNYGLGSSIETSAYTLFYQPLPADQQVRARALADGIVQPTAIGIAGVLLVILNTLLGFDAVGLSFIFLFFAAAWLTVLILVTREYPIMLMRALNRRFLGQTPLPVVDITALQVIERGLAMPSPAAAIYSLNLLEQVTGTLPLRVLPMLLAHPAPDVRRDTLRRIERLRLQAALPAVTQHIHAETSPLVKGAALRTLAAVSGTNARDIVLPYLDAADAPVRQGALVGLLRRDGHERDDARQRLTSLVLSPDAGERILAAQILGELDSAGFDQPLAKLLNDPNPTVRRAALMSAAKPTYPQFWTTLIDALNAPETRQTAATALVSAGQVVMPALREAFASSTSSSDVQARIANIAGRIGGAASADLLVSGIDHRDPHVRSAVLQALSRIGFEATGHASLVQAQIRAEADFMAYLLVSILDVGDDQYTALLHSALNDMMAQARERVFHLLAFLYGAHPVYRARDTLRSGTDTRRAYALEVIDTVTAQELKSVVLPLLEDLAPAERLARLTVAFPQTRLARPQRLTDLIESAPVTDWVRAVALYTAGVTRATMCRYAVDVAVASPAGLVRETALWARTRIAFVTAQTGEARMLTQATEWSHRTKGGTLTKRHAMFSTIEKVIILKSVAMFSETPDEALTEIAMLLEEQDADADQTIVLKGDPGTSMYIITSGKVRVHDGDHTFNTLGDNEVFGELTLLDSEPRSASVTAVEPTHLFKLEQEPFYELMNDHGEVARGIIRMLVGTVRLRVQELKALNPPLHDQASTSIVNPPGA